MLSLSVEQSAELRGWFLPDRPGPLVGLHVLKTGHGMCLVDRWPAPRVVLVGTEGTCVLVGEPDVLAPGDLRAHILVGSIEAPERFEGLLHAAFPVVNDWQRVVLDLSTRPAQVDPPVGVIVRILGPADAADIASLDPELAWIAGTWGGPVGLAAGGFAWGAFAHDRLVAVACSFFVGEHYEDIGVVTLAAYRRLGLSTACAGGLCRDIQSRGRRPSWTTPTDNRPGLRVAQKLGFVMQRRHRLHLIGQSAPVPAQ